MTLLFFRISRFISVGSVAFVSISEFSRELPFESLLECRSGCSNLLVCPILFTKCTFRFFGSVGTICNHLYTSCMCLMWTKGIKSSTIVSCHACAIPVHLGGVLPRADTTIMASPTFVSVNDDLAASEPNVTTRPINHKMARWVKMEDGFLV